MAVTCYCTVVNIFMVGNPVTDSRLNVSKLIFNFSFTDKSYWRTKAIEAVHKKLQEKRIKGVAKNIIFFLGDGMSVPTITASRIFLGQLNDQSGENARLSFEELPYTGVSKV